MLLLLACQAPDPLPAVEAPDSNLRVVEIVLDRGTFDADGWISEPSTDRLLSPTATQAGDRAIATLPDGPHVAQIERGCGLVQVPFLVDADTVVISLPYPRCEAQPPPGLWTGDDLARLHTLDLFPDWPADPGDVAVWPTLAEARAACAWYGSSLPTTTMPTDPAVWLDSGEVQGGAWPSPTHIPPTARDHTLGVRCESHP